MELKVRILTLEKIVYLIKNENMCFFYGINKSVKQIEKAFNAKFDNPDFEPIQEVNGFAHPFMPIIVDKRPDIITGANWGLLPTWAKDTSFQKNTLNARIETLDEKPSFKNAIKNRCLIPATNFYEWQWKDPKGKEKEKFSINTKEEIFAFAGLYSIWKNPQTGNFMLTYTILTTEANELMAEIHNNKKRMPVVLNNEHHALWLQGDNYKDFAYPYQSNLMADPVL